LLLIGCSQSDDQQPTEAAVNQFHRLYGAGRYADIYRAAEGEFQATGPEAEFVAFLRSIHERLGAFRDAQRRSAETRPSNRGGTLVHLTYASRFEHGAAREAFTYRVTNGRAVLLRFDIDADALAVPEETPPVVPPPPPPTENLGAPPR
jgi:hypothetical protein